MRSSRSVLFTALAMAWAALAIFPVLWMAAMTVKPEASGVSMVAISEGQDFK